MHRRPYTAKPTKAQVSESLDWMRAIFDNRKDIEMARITTKRTEQVNATTGEITAMPILRTGDASITTAVKTEKLFFSASRMRDGELIEGIVRKVDSVDFTKEELRYTPNGDESTEIVGSAVCRYHLVWFGTEFVFMGTPNVDEGIGGAQRGDYVSVKRLGTKKTRSGYNVVEFETRIAKAGTFQLPAIPAKAITE